MVESTAVSCIHPDKYNNSVDRIISKEEEREDPRRDSSIYLQVQWCFHILQRTTRNPASFQSSRAKKTILHTELILLQEFSKKYYNYKAHPVQINTRHLPVTVPRTSEHSTWQNKAPGSPKAFQAYTALAGFQLILPSRIALQAAASIHAAPTVAPRRIPTEFYQEIHFKRVKYCISMQY